MNEEEEEEVFFFFFLDFLFFLNFQHVQQKSALFAFSSKRKSSSRFKSICSRIQMMMSSPPPPPSVSLSTLSAKTMILTRTIQTTRKTGRGRRERRSFSSSSSSALTSKTLKTKSTTTTRREGRRRRRGRRESTFRTRANEDDEDFAIFRFTLGIPGFDDGDIPRVLGVLAGALLLANHASSGNVSSAQSRAELIGALLVCACFYAPELGRRIQEATTGSSSSSKKNSVDMLGGSSQFLVEESYKETKNTNYAWASYAALTNTNAKGVAFFEDTNEGKLMMTVARGSVRTIEDGASASSNSEVLRKLAKGFSYDRLDVKEDGNLYLSSRMELDAAEANRWEFLPPGAESAVVRRAKTGSKGVVVAYSDQPRAFNAKARLWLGALAEKMSTSD
jgi:hypothetical protein